MFSIFFGSMHLSTAFIELTVVSLSLLWLIILLSGSDDKNI